MSDERFLQSQVSELIKIAAEVANRRYLPNLERCRTIRDARATVGQYDGYHMNLVDRIMLVADAIRRGEGV